MTKSSKQIWYIIAIIAVILLGGWALMNRGGAISFFGGNTGTQATSTDDTTDTTGGTTGTTGTIGTGGGAFPAGWPADAPALQSGAKITYSGTLDPKTKLAGPTVVYTVSSTPASAVAFFKSQFSRQGWTFRGQGNVEGSVQLAATKGTRKVTVGIAETRPGVLEVTVGISEL